MSLELALLLAALALILVEIFFVPGVGVFGIVGFLLLIASIVMIGQDHGGLAATGVFVGSILFIAAAFVLFFRSPASKYLVHQDHFASSAETKEKPLIEPGAEGESISDLHPYGWAVFPTESGERKLDVSAISGFIAKGSSVQVQRVEGNRVFVRETKRKPPEEA